MQGYIRFCIKYKINSENQILKVIPSFLFKIWCKWNDFAKSYFLKKLLNTKIKDPFEITFGRLKSDFEKLKVEFGVR